MHTLVALQFLGPVCEDVSDGVNDVCESDVMIMCVCVCVCV